MSSSSSAVLSSAAAGAAAAAGAGAADAAANALRPIPCTVTREEFRASKLALTKACPSCGLLVARHPSERDLAVVAAAPAAAVNASAVNDPAVADLRDRERPPKWDFTKSHSLVKDVKWKRNSDTQTSARFFGRLEVLLIQFSEFKDTEWLKLIPALMEDHDAARWVLENIANVDPPLTWTQGLEKFGAHFDTADSRDRLREQYHHCAMRSKETVQQFTTRFMTLVSKLGYDLTSDGEARSIEDLIDRLPAKLKARWKFWKDTVRADDVQELERLQKLSKVIQRLISLSISDPELTTPAADSVEDNRASRSRSAQRPAPRSTGAKRRNASASDSFDKDARRSKEPRSLGGYNSNRRDSSDDRSHSKSARNSAVTCYSCGAQGHKSPDCPQQSKSGQNAPASAGNRSASGSADQGMGSTRFPSYGQQQQSSAGAARRTFPSAVPKGKDSAASAASMHIDRGEESDRSPAHSVESDGDRSQSDSV